MTDKTKSTACCFLVVLLLTFGTPNHAQEAASPEGKVLLQDDFQRDEAEPDQEQIGNSWGTNSRKRAAGNKQADLEGGALHVTRHPLADHGVSVFHDVEFRNATIDLRFKLGPQDDLGINIADLQEKSVHAGHLCVAKIRLNQVELTDLKTGNMNLQMRAARLEGKLSGNDKKLLASKTKRFTVDLKPNHWHKLRVQIDDNTMRVSINGSPVGEFSSPGIAHPTKRRLRLAVNRSAWIDDVSIREF